MIASPSVAAADNVVFVVALLVLGITYMLAAFIRLEIVNPPSALTWYVAGALFFAVGPSLYQGMNDFRMQISETFANEANVFAQAGLTNLTQLIRYIS